MTSLYSPNSSFNVYSYICNSHGCKTVFLRKLIWGAFHSTKFSGLKFWVFHATNGTVFSGSKFGATTEDSFTFVYLLSGCSIDDAEVKINDVLGERDNTTYNLS